MVLGVKVAIPKSAAASLEALANFALDGCEEPFGATGDAYDTASTAVRNPFGGSDVTVRNPPRILRAALVFIVQKWFHPAVCRHRTHTLAADAEMFMATCKLLEYALLPVLIIIKQARANHVLRTCRSY